MQNKNGIKRLVKNSCAGYLGAKQGIPNYCCLQDAPCVFFAQDDDLPRCTYFSFLRFLKRYIIVLSMIFNIIQFQHTYTFLKFRQTIGLM
ncbi:UNVERIFIED_CONTAM: hypothetical protein ABIC26_004308 [Paenibacillus sp. PvR008]